MNAVEFASTAILPNKSIELIVIEAVTDEDVGLHIAMFVNTAVVPAGVVYSVVLDVDAAVLASTLDVTAISNCTFLSRCP